MYTAERSMGGSINTKTFYVSLIVLIKLHELIAWTTLNVIMSIIMLLYWRQSQDYSLYIYIYTYIIHVILLRHVQLKKSFSIMIYCLYFLTSWRTFYTCTFWNYSILFDVKKVLLDVMTHSWHNDIHFYIMMLLLYVVLDVMTYFLKPSYNLLTS